MYVYNYLLCYTCNTCNVLIIHANGSFTKLYDKKITKTTR